uniref:Uncharacterized protein n=1 Tax=Tanacetum cinerariifolium TaxID=118510 RepID=A0A6L2NE63_TANCI|nr:hypothetical protein [Tanacetum cinerariifolium]
MYNLTDITGQELPPFDMVDIDLFTVVALNMMVVKLGYTSKSEPLFYNYLRPLTSLDEGLYALACEEDVRCLATLVRRFKLIEVYIEHGVMDLDSYIRPPWFWETIKDITYEPGSIAVNRTEKILLLSWHEYSELTKEPVCDFVTPSSLPQHGSSTPYVGRTHETIMVEVSTHEPIVEEVGTQEPIAEDVVLEDYVSSRENADKVMVKKMNHLLLMDSSSMMMKE